MLVALQPMGDVAVVNMLAVGFGALLSAYAEDFNTFLRRWG